VSGYLALAKRAGKGHPDPSEGLAARREREIEEAGRRGLIIRWSEYPSWIKLHDPTTGQWHEVRAEECLPGVVETANKYRKKKGGTA
jgi:hypothetical protein